MSELYFKAPATIKGYRTKVDRSVTITVETDQELQPAEAAALQHMLMTSGIFGFVMSEDSQLLDDLEAPEEILPLGKKSISQRMRDVLYRLWEFHGSTGSFNDYYNNQGEAIISQLKKRLPERN